MSLRKKIYQSDYPYHIYNRCNNREFLFERQKYFPLFMDCIQGISKKTNFQCHHFILMTNHFHMIGSTPKSNLYEFMKTFQTTISQLINAMSGRANHIFGGRYRATVIASEQYLINVIRYLYQNPVKAKIVKNSKDYPFSTLHAYMNGQWKKRGLYPDPYIKVLCQNGNFKILEEVAENKLDDDTWDDTQIKLRKREIK